MAVRWNQKTRWERKWKKKKKVPTTPTTNCRSSDPKTEKHRDRFIAPPYHLILAVCFQIQQPSLPTLFLLHHLACMNGAYSFFFILLLLFYFNGATFTSLFHRSPYRIAQFYCPSRQSTVRIL